MPRFSVPAVLAPLVLLVVAASPTSAEPAFALDIHRLWPTAGAGAMATENRDVGRFRGVQLSTGARVVIRQGDRDAVAVEAEANMLPLIETHVDAGTLVVKDIKPFRSSSARVVVTARRLERIATSSSVAVVADGLGVPALSISTGGSSTLSMASLAVGSLNAALGGSSAVKISGRADQVSMQLGGSAAMQAGELAAKSVAISGGGSSHVVASAAESLSISLGGSASVGYFGPVQPTLATSGSSSVRHLGAAPPPR